MIDVYPLIIPLYVRGGSQGQLDTLYGGDYKSFGERLRSLVNKLRSIEVEPIFVADGVVQNEKLREVLRRYTEHQKSTYRQISDPRKREWGNCQLLEKTVFSVLREKHVQYYDQSWRKHITFF